MPTVKRRASPSSFFICENNAASLPTAPSVIKTTCFIKSLVVVRLSAALSAGAISVPPPALRCFTKSLAYCLFRVVPSTEVSNKRVVSLLNATTLNRSFSLKRSIANCKLSFASTIGRPPIEPDVSITKVISRSKSCKSWLFTCGGISITRA